MQQIFMFMKYSSTLISLFCCISVLAQKPKPPVVAVKYSPLAAYSAEWNKPLYAKCNTAEKVTYMSTKEKNVVYVLNLVRTYPKLFANTVLIKYPERSGNEFLTDNIYYFQSLLDTLLHMEPVLMLTPDKSCYTSAQCHAYQSGITGYEGHERKKAECKEKRYFNGECCDYGHDDALEIVLSLLIDEGVETLGHRIICLTNYPMLGVSIEPHKKWNFNAVLDFHF